MSTSLLCSGARVGACLDSLPMPMMSGFFYSQHQYTPVSEVCLSCFSTVEENVNFIALMFRSGSRCKAGQFIFANDGIIKKTLFVWFMKAIIWVY